MQHGIIGAVAAIVALSSVPRLDASLSQSANGSEETQLTAGAGVHIEQATQLLETVKCKCEGSWRAGVFFYDELASALITVRTRSDTRIKASSLDWMNENLTSTLEDTYLDDLPEDETGKDEESLKMPEYTAKAFNGMHKTLRVRGELNLDGDNSQLLLNAVKLLDSAEKSQSEAQKERLQMMCALLRLVGAMEWATKDSLEGVDALAGCPIFLFDEMHIEDFKLLEPHEQTHIALLLFYVSNWIIEVLNVFCLQPDKDMKNKLVQRANHLLMLLEKLDRVLDMFAIQLPDLNASLELDALAGPSASRGAGRPKGKGKTGECGKGKDKAKGKAKGKGKAKDDDSDSDSIHSPSSAKGKGKDDEAEEDEGGASSKKGTASGGVATVNNNNKTKLQVASSTGFLTEFVTLRAQASCFRQLDLTVHNVLTYTDEDRKRSAGASKDGGEPGREVLNDCAVLALLQDLWSKVDGMVSQRRSFPFNRGGVAATAHRRQMEPLVKFSKKNSLLITW
jgi:Fanconi anemia group D2 protein